MGMADKRPKRMLMVVMFKAEHNQITQMWADLDKEGLGSKKVGCRRQAQTSPPARLPSPPKLEQLHHHNGLSCSV